MSRPGVVASVYSFVDVPSQNKLSVDLVLCETGDSSNCANADLASLRSTDSISNDIFADALTVCSPCASSNREC